MTGESAWCTQLQSDFIAKYRYLGTFGTFHSLATNLSWSIFRAKLKVGNIFLSLKNIKLMCKFACKEEI